MMIITKREMLSHQIEELGGINYSEIEKENDNVKKIFSKKLVNWTLAYFIMVSLALAIKSLFSPFKYPEALIEILVIMIFLPSMIIYGSAIGSTKIVLPRAAMVYNKALFDDIRSAKSRGFDKMAGPIIGFSYAIIILLLVMIESSFG